MSEFSKQSILVYILTCIWNNWHMAYYVYKHLIMKVPFCSKQWIRECLGNPIPAILRLCISYSNILAKPGVYIFCEFIYKYIFKILSHSIKYTTHTCYWKPFSKVLWNVTPRVNIVTQVNIRRSHLCVTWIMKTSFKFFFF